MVIPLFVGRDKSIVALDRAMNSGKKILLIAQKKADLDDPAPADLYKVGTLATILQLLKLPDGTVKVLVEGGERARIDQILVSDHFAFPCSRKKTSTTNVRSTFLSARSSPSSSST
jgi:ATP-dependent Lon protease